MAEIVNLRMARKARARKAAEAKASENRARFGRTKAEKQKAKADYERIERTVEGARREDENPRGNTAHRDDM